MDPGEQRLERSYSALGFETWLSARLPASPASPRGKRRTPAGRQPWAGRRHPHPATGLHAVLGLCSLSFQTGSSLRLLRHRGGFSTAALALQASTQHSCSRLTSPVSVSQNLTRFTSPAYLAVSHAFLSQLPWHKQKCVFPHRNA